MTNRYPQTYPQISRAYPQLSGAYTQTSRTYPQLARRSPQIGASYPQKNELSTALSTADKQTILLASWQGFGGGHNRIQHFNNLKTFHSFHPFPTNAKILSMSDIIISMSGYGQFKMTLDLVDPADTEDDVEVWTATFCDQESNDCQVVYFEMGTDYEYWDIVDEAIQAYRDEVLPDNGDSA